MSDIPKIAEIFCLHCYKTFRFINDNDYSYIVRRCPNCENDSGKLIGFNDLIRNKKP